MSLITWQYFTLSSMKISRHSRNIERFHLKTVNLGEWFTYYRLKNSVLCMGSLKELYIYATMFTPS